MDHIRNFCDNGDMISLARIDNETSSFALALVPYVLDKYPDRYNIYHKRALQIKELFSRASPMGENNCNLRGLKNIGSSCYLDSTLLALFVVPNWFIDETILNSNLTARNGPSFSCAKSIKNSDDIMELSSMQNIDLNNRKAVQVQLRAIAESIRGTGDGVAYCTNLRKSLKNCHSTEDFHKKGEKDAGEFLRYIFNMFDTDVAHKQVVTVATHDLSDDPEELVDVSVVDDRKASIIQFIDPLWLSSLNQRTSHFMSEFLTSLDDSELGEDNLFIHQGIGYERRIATTTLISTPYLIFSFERTDVITEKYIRTRIVPSETLTIADGSRFKLSAIVIHQHPFEHYTACFKCGEYWYEYDDIGARITKIGNGSYGALLKHRPSPLTHGTLYYYTPTSSVIYLKG